MLITFLGYYLMGVFATEAIGNITLTFSSKLRKLLEKTIKNLEEVDPIFIAVINKLSVLSWIGFIVFFIFTIKLYLCEDDLINKL